MSTYPARRKLELIAFMATIIGRGVAKAKPTKSGTCSETTLAVPTACTLAAAKADPAPVDRAGLDRALSLALRLLRIPLRISQRSSEF